MFPQKIGYHDIADVEQFCNRIIHRSRLELSWHERDDLLAYLVETCWQLAEDFRPGGIRFSTYAGNTLARRVIDWVRARYGRTRWTNPNGQDGTVYERDRVEFVSIEGDLTGNRRGVEYHLHAHINNELARAYEREQVDATTPSSPDLMRALLEGGSTAARDEREVGEGTDAEAA